MDLGLDLDERRDIVARGGLFRCSLCKSNKGSVLLLGRVLVSIWG